MSRGPGERSVAKSRRTDSKESSGTAACNGRKTVSGPADAGASGSASHPHYQTHRRTSDPRLRVATTATTDCLIAAVGTHRHHQRETDPLRLCSTHPH